MRVGHLFLTFRLFVVAALPRLRLVDFPPLPRTAPPPLPPSRPPLPPRGPAQPVVQVQVQQQQQQQQSLHRQTIHVVAEEWRDYYSSSTYGLFFVFHFSRPLDLLETNSVACLAFHVACQAVGLLFVFLVCLFHRLIFRQHRSQQQPVFSAIKPSGRRKWWQPQQSQRRITCTASSTACSTPTNSATTSSFLGRCPQRHFFRERLDNGLVFRTQRK